MSWKGRVASVQPRVRLTRSFDQRFHNYLGYALRIEGVVGEEERAFLVGVGKAAQAKHEFRVGDIVSGEAEPVSNPQTDPVDFYRASKLKLVERPALEPARPPPWTGPPVELELYRERAHRRLDARTYATKCQACIWGCRMAVEIIVDQWKPEQKRYRFETFCYGPKSCSFYRAGATRKVSGRKGMTWEEPDWVDEEATSHRSMDE